MGLGDTASPQAPVPLDDPPGPAVLCACTLTSLTQATAPTDRARKRIGAGEGVNVTCDKASPKWSFTTSSGQTTAGALPAVVRLFIPSGDKVLLAAGDTAGTVTRDRGRRRVHL